MATVKVRWILRKTDRHGRASARQQRHLLRNLSFGSTHQRAERSAAQLVFYTPRRAVMRRDRIAALVLLTAGALAGYGAATGRFNSAAPDEPKVSADKAPPPGSPAATRVIDGKQLPAPDPQFGGKIEKT